jgi:5-methylcytosine-specific restriction protein A
MAVPGSAYCRTHQPARAPKQVDAFYVTPAWRTFRAWYLSRHPCCEVCLREGRTVPATLVHHRVELKDGGARTAEENAEALCVKCHALVTAKNRQQRTRENRRASLGAT